MSTPSEADQMILMCAEWLEEHGDPRAEDLRARAQWRPLFNGVCPTGSRVYGTPRPDSDWDLVLFVTENVARWLAEGADSSFTVTDTDEYIIHPYPDGAPYVTKHIAMRFGKLNVIAMWDEREFVGWSRATAMLHGWRPVTRDDAIKAIDKHIAQARSATFKYGQ